MAEQEQTVTERRGGAHQGWEKVPPPQGLAQRPGPAIPRGEGAAPGQMSWLSAQIQGSGMRGGQARKGRQAVLPCSLPGLFLCPFPGSSITCLIPSTGLNASPLHLHSVSRVTSNVTSFLPSSIHWSISFNQTMEKPVWALNFKAPLKELTV